MLPRGAHPAARRIFQIVVPVAGLVLLSLATAGTAEARTGSEPVSFTAQVPRAIDTVVMPPVDEARYLQEDADREAQGIDGPYRFAAPLDVHIAESTDGTWTDLAGGGRLWRLEVVSTGARTLNFGFTTFRLPEGATVHFYPSDRQEYDGPYTAADATPDGQLWTPVIRGDAAVIEMFVPAAPEFEPVLVLQRVSHDYRGFGQIAERLEKHGACNNNVVCPEWDPWDDQINSVGVYKLSGAWMCSGQMMNTNTPGLPPPYFLTAYHCGITSVNAGTVVVYWNYQSPTCGQHGGGSLAQNQMGSTLKARWSTSDFCLIQLNADPQESWNVYYSGWNADEANAPANCHAIHHPNTDVKSISFNDSPITVTSYLQTQVPGDGSHWRIDNWEDGTTEPGSSGSGIWDPQHRLVGQLHGGYASCSSITSDWYGRFPRSWTGGGASSSRVKDWLDPNNTGVLVLDGRYHTATEDVAESAPALPSALRAITPNPARDAFAVEFDLAAYGRVGLDIFDAAGRLVGVVPAKAYTAGSGTLRIGQDGEVRLGPGLYFVRLMIDGRDAGSRKLIVVE
jgi:hypothetical protein